MSSLVLMPVLLLAGASPPPVPAVPTSAAVDGGAQQGASPLPSSVVVPTPAIVPSTATPVDAGDPAAPAAEALPAGSAAPVLPADPADVATQSSDEETITVTARPRRVPGDPLQQVNAQSFAITQAVDDAVIAPAAHVYEEILPKPVRNGLRNFLNNLHEPIIALNFLLQLKVGKAAETVGRFAINSTLGIAGVFDFAKRRAFKLPRRRNGFANTLGFWGVGPGPFLFLPLVGATTLRDLLGGVVDGAIPPLAGKPFNQRTYTIITGINRGLDRRVELDEQIKKIREAGDPYTASRRSYLERRQAEIDALHTRHKKPACVTGQGLGCDTSVPPTP